MTKTRKCGEPLSVRSTDHCPNPAMHEYVESKGRDKSHKVMLDALRQVLKVMYANPSENMDMITKCSTTVKMAIADGEGKGWL